MGENRAEGLKIDWQGWEAAQSVNPYYVWTW